MFSGRVSSCIRPDRLYLEDIVAAADAIVAFVSGRDASAFAADDIVRSAVLFKLIVIGEAASKVSPELRARLVDVPWQDVVGFRNVAVHAYFGVDWDIVWTTATEDIPPLRERVASLLTASESI
jgi:uncharacterized protein with HEPN domain